MLKERLDEGKLTTIERDGITVVPSDRKKAVYVMIDPKTKKAILHCGKHGQIYMKIDEMLEVLEDAMDIFAHLGY